MVFLLFRILVYSNHIVYWAYCFSWKIYSIYSTDFYIHDDYNHPSANALAIRRKSVNSRKCRPRHFLNRARASKVSGWRLNSYKNLIFYLLWIYVIYFTFVQNFLEKGCKCENNITVRWRFKLENGHPNQLSKPPIVHSWPQLGRAGCLKK